MAEDFLNSMRAFWGLPPYPVNDPDDLTEEEWGALKLMDIERCPYLCSDPEYAEWNRKNRGRMKTIAQERLRNK